jgi:hypothetical protein
MTAVEWLQEQLKKGVDFNPLDKNSYLNNVEKLFQQAKEMEKEQIVNAFENGKEKMEQFQDEIPDEDETIYLMYGSEYYNETFKSE